MPDAATPRGALQTIVAFLCYEASYMSTRKLVKLVYLVDLYHYRMFGRRATAVPFKHWYHGAYAPDVEEATEQLYELGILKEEAVSAQKGLMASVSRLREKTIRGILPRTVWDAMNAVIEDWGSAMPQDVVNFTRETLPFVNTPFGELIDFGRTDPVDARLMEVEISEEDAAMEELRRNESVLAAALKGKREIAEGRELLTHDQVFGSE